MQNSFDPIFQPIVINNLEIKNRIAMAPMTMNYAGLNHSVSDQQLAYYAARAKGGTGLIITEAINASDHPAVVKTRKGTSLSITNEHFVPGMSELVEHVHSFGAKIFCQLALGPGRQGIPGLDNTQLISASPIPYKRYPEYLINGVDPIAMFRAYGYQREIPQFSDINEVIYFSNKIPGLHLKGEVPRELTIEEIKKLVNDIGNSAMFAKRSGFDGIEIHASHGHLLHTFISARSNVRSDEYGTTFENRLRFLVECIRSCRKYVGPDYIIGVRISASDTLPEGFDEQYSKKVAKRCEEEGVNFIHLSDGSYEKLDGVLPNTDATVIDKCAVIKEDLNIPIICPSVHDPDSVLNVITSKKADLISQGRQQIADPDWVNKLIQGKKEDIIKCTRCNIGCITRFLMGLPCRCIQNPIVGQERFIDDYIKRPILPIEERPWQTLKEIGKEPIKPLEEIKSE